MYSFHCEGCDNIIPFEKRIAIVEIDESAFGAYFRFACSIPCADKIAHTIMDMEVKGAERWHDIRVYRLKTRWTAC